MEIIYVVKFYNNLRRKYIVKNIFKNLTINNKGILNHKNKRR